MLPMTQRAIAWAVSAAVVAAMGYWWWDAGRSSRSVDGVLDAVPSAPRAAAPVEHPIEAALAAIGAAPPAVPPPPLDVSDNEVQETLAAIIGRSTFLQLVRAGDLVRHVVATVDNLPRKTLAARLNPVKPVPGVFRPSDDGRSSADNDARYAPYVAAFETIDSQKLIATYIYFYPLFQQAYRELGYPNGYFNDRLVEAIDVLLTTPELGHPIRLVQPKVLYEFEDRDLEALPAGQKIMLRIGEQNAARVKAKLAELRHGLTGR
jgi:DUF3014 family protein